MKLSLPLKWLTEVYRKGQITDFTIRGNLSLELLPTCLIPAQQLQQWLLMSSSKTCTLRLLFFFFGSDSKISIENNQIIDLLLTDYMTLFDARIKHFQSVQIINCREIFLRYPIPYPERITDNIYEYGSVSSIFFYDLSDASVIQSC